MRIEITPALLVIDVQNCFVAPGGTFDGLGFDLTPYRDALPTVVEACKRASDLGMPRLFSRAVREASGLDNLDRDHQILPASRLERIREVPISVRGTWDSELMDQLPLTDDDLIVDKRRDSVFQDTELELWLRSLEVDALAFAGFDTAICVESTLRDAFNRGWDVILLEDATASRQPRHKDTTCEEVRENFGLVLDTSTFFDSLEPVEEGRFALDVVDVSEGEAEGMR